MEEPRSRSKRDLDDNGVEENKEDEEDDEWTKTLEGESKCKARFWKCIGKVATGSLHYMDEPGGISGAMKKMLFRMAFHGGIGNFWKALMTIPEVKLFFLSFFFSCTLEQNSAFNPKVPWNLMLENVNFVKYVNF